MTDNCVGDFNFLIMKKMAEKSKIMIPANSKIR